MNVIVAIPTIEERGSAWQDCAVKWLETSPEGTLCVPSWRKGGWAQGLNEVVEEHPRPDIFVAASDDMIPEPGWYEAIAPFVYKAIVAPQVVDPRFTRFTDEVQDGDETKMSSFPIIAGKFLRHVFPILPHEPQHYFADNLISDKARKEGIPTVAVPSAVITHLMDPRARGAGMGSEDARMAFDKAVYNRL